MKQIVDSGSTPNREHTVQKWLSQQKYQNSCENWTFLLLAVEKQRSHWGMEEDADVAWRTTWAIAVSTQSLFLTWASTLKMYFVDMLNISVNLKSEIWKRISLCYSICEWNDVVIISSTRSMTLMPCLQGLLKDCEKQQQLPRYLNPHWPHYLQNPELSQNE